MSNYQVVLDDSDKVIDKIASAFQGADIRLSKVADEWVLESNEFECCVNADDVLKKANVLLFRLNVLLGVYPFIVTPLKAKYINYTKADGKRSRRIWGAMQVNVYDHKALEELSVKNDRNTTGSKLLVQSYTDPSLEELLTIIGLPPLKWSQIYDVIEFMGDDKGIEKRGYTTKKEVRRIRQTANYYRHLGRRKKELLPDNPPTLQEAADFTYRIIKQWLSGFA